MKIDINCDVGEGIGNDAAIMPFISSCNICCGVHAGSREVTRETILLAKKHSVKIGAHPSYPDREHFGRVVMDISFEELSKSIQEQLETFTSLLENCDAQLHHIKPHGALFNEAAINPEVAKAVVEAIKNLDIQTNVYTLPNSELAKCAQKSNLPVIKEGFADRLYDDNLRLVSRKVKGSVLHDKETIYDQVYNMAARQQVFTNSGNLKLLDIQTICVHGDNPTAVEIVKYLYEKLPTEGVEIA